MISDLYKVGETSIKPRTSFYWSFDQDALIEVTELGDHYFLVKASKAYYLLNQDEEGRETWNRNISKLNDYLAETFSQYRLSIDYSNELDPDILDVKDDAAELGREADEILRQKKQVQREKSRLENSYDMSLPEFEPVLESKLSTKADQQEKIDQALDEIVFELEEKNEVLNQWKQDGVMSAILFQFSSEIEAVPSSDLRNGVEKHLDKVQGYHRSRVKQILTGGKFRLVVEDVEHPRVLIRSEHSALINPKTLQEITEQHPGLEETLGELKQEYLSQFQPHALKDIRTNTRTYQEKKSTPSQATAAILRQLDTTSSTSVNPEDVPNNGPFIGTIKDTKQVVGFDPAEEGPHFYIVGETGSGKSHLKRIFIENIVSQNYDVLTINPSDTQNIGLNLPNQNGEYEGRGLGFNQYWAADSEHLLDVPQDIEQLFSGRNAVTLQGLSSTDKQEFVYKIFKKANELDRKDKTLFIFLDEAHKFNEGETAEAIQDAVREARKFGINIVLISQSPKDFTHSYKKIRENTVNVFLRGEYFDYADNFIQDKTAISQLQLGEAIFPASLNWEEFTVEARDTLTRFWSETPSTAEVEEVDSMFDPELPEFDEGLESGQVDRAESKPSDEMSLTEDEESILEYIRHYITEKDEAPSYSKCWRPDHSPFGSTKTRRLLDQLVEKDCLVESVESRYGNETTVYRLTSSPA